MSDDGFARAMILTFVTIGLIAWCVHCWQRSVKCEAKGGAPVYIGHAYVCLAPGVVIP